MTRSEHLNWCKERALEYVKNGQYDDALASMLSDLRKHPDTEHSALTGATLGLGLKMAGELNSAHDMTRFIEGFN